MQSGTPRITSCGEPFPREALGEYLRHMRSDEITIGGLAERTDFSRETIRFYEREGLVVPARRSDSGYRLYDEEAVARLRFISQAKLLGFTLRDIRVFIGLEVEDKASCASVLEQVEAKLEEVRERIETLHRIEKQLAALQATCKKTRGGERCGFLSSSFTPRSS